ncbi:hypothetical protein ACHAW6_010962, partial [Cyclotella cf. meneghiniana]
VCRNLQGLFQPAVSQLTGPGTAREASQQAQTLPKHKKSWTIDTQMASYPVYTQRGAPFHARLCEYSIDVIPTDTSTQTTKSIILTHTSKIWCKNEVCQTSRLFSKAQQTGQKNYSRSHQIGSILCKSH